MNSVAELLRQLHHIGVQLEVRGNRLRYFPSERVGVELLDFIKNHKAELIAICLNPQRQAECSFTLLPRHSAEKGVESNFDGSHSAELGTKCPLDHRDSTTWEYGPDRHGRPDFRRVTCRKCDKFYGYAQWRLN